jgi:hypothetical protein
MAEHVALKKKSWGTLTGVWVPHDTRDQIVDFVRRWSGRTEIGAGRFIRWLDITASKFYGWRERYGKVNEHNRWVPRDFWLEDWEKQAIIAFHLKNPLEGYRRLTFMMLDADIVAVSPASVWRVLSRAGLMRKWSGKPSKKGTGFEQPPQPHQHWHIDVSYLNVCRLLPVADHSSRIDAPMNGEFKLTWYFSSNARAFGLFPSVRYAPHETPWSPHSPRRASPRRSRPPYPLSPHVLRFSR